MQTTAQIPWEGGDCPVQFNARVIVVYRDGITSKIRRAGDLRWLHAALSDDIISYAEVITREELPQ